MKKLLVLLFASTLILTLSFSRDAHSSLIMDTNNPCAELDLYEIFNDLFGVNYASSDALWEDLGEENAAAWYQTSELVTIMATIRYAGYDQELGFQDAEGYHTLLSDIPWGIEYTDVTFTTVSQFSWVEVLSGSGSGVGPWYSSTDENIDEMVHFLAFYVGDFFENTDHAWLIAFEDLHGLGDSDFNDLVVLLVGASPVPLPSTLLLLLSGVIGFAGFRKFKK